MTLILLSMPSTSWYRAASGSGPECRAGRARGFLRRAVAARFRCVVPCDTHSATRAQRSRRAVLLEFLQCGAHLVTALRAKQFEERAYILAVPAASDPQHALARGLDDHRGIAVTLLDRELIEHDDPEAVDDRPEFPLQTREIELLDGLPVEPKVARHVADRHDLTQPAHRLGQAARHARVSIAPS